MSRWRATRMLAGGVAGAQAPDRLTPRRPTRAGHDRVGRRRSRVRAVHPDPTRRFVVPKRSGSCRIGSSGCLHERCPQVLPPRHASCWPRPPRRRGGSAPLSLTGASMTSTRRRRRRPSGQRGSGPRASPSPRWSPSPGPPPWLPPRAAPAPATSHQRQQDRRHHRRDGPADRHQLVRHGDRQQDVPRPVGRAPATWRSQLDHMAQLGYNTLRVPYSGDALKPGAVATEHQRLHQPRPGRAVAAADPRQGRRLRRQPRACGSSSTGTGRPRPGRPRSGTRRGRPRPA